MNITDYLSYVLIHQYIFREVTLEYDLRFIKFKLVKLIGLIAFVRLMLFSSGINIDTSYFDIYTLLWILLEICKSLTTKSISGR